LTKDLNFPLQRLNKERNLKLLSFVAPYLQKLKINPEQIEGEPAILVKGFDDILGYVLTLSHIPRRK
jgi:hypothetical protein